MYRYVDKKSFLNWGLTSDWLVEGPRKRRLSAAASGWGYGTVASSSSPSAAVPRGCDGLDASGEDEGAGAEGAQAEDPNASSEGYGEMTEGSIERLLSFLKTLAFNDTLAAPLPAAPSTPPNARTTSRTASSTVPRVTEPSQAPAVDLRWNLTPSSGFIDVGSGYGKVVFHAKLSAKVGRACGIEYVTSRAQMAIQVRDELVTGKHAFMTDEARAALTGDGFELIDGDATKYGAFDFSHVYIYDKVFSDPTIELIAKQLNASQYRVLVSYQRIEVWRRLGLQNVTEIAALTMRTTGGQNFKAYVYVNEAAGGTQW